VKNGCSPSSERTADKGYWEESGRTDDEDVSQAGGEHVTVGILHVHYIEGTGVTLPATKKQLQSQEKVARGGKF
jgi:hypothetical protein